MLQTLHFFALSYESLVWLSSFQLPVLHKFALATSPWNVPGAVLSQSSSSSSPSQSEWMWPNQENHSHQLIRQWGAIASCTPAQVLLLLWPGILLLQLPLLPKADADVCWQCNTVNLLPVRKQIHTEKHCGAWFHRNDQVDVIHCFMWLICTAGDSSHCATPFV